MIYPNPNGGILTFTTPEGVPHFEVYTQAMERRERDRLAFNAWRKSVEDRLDALETKNEIRN